MEIRQRGAVSDEELTDDGRRLEIVQFFFDLAVLVNGSSHFDWNID